MNVWTSLRRRFGRVSIARALHQPDEPPPPQCDGSLEELSGLHARGWIRDATSLGERVGYEIVLPGVPEEVLAAGRADQFWFGLAWAGIGDGAHAFWTRLSRPIDSAERARVVVRTKSGGAVIARSEELSDAYEPLLHVAMDIVDNCNLRCPFCLYDYANTRATHFMSSETLGAALRFLPYARDGEFWFSCLHEPTLHPELIQFVERVPRDYRRKLFFTTNLAKRMARDYFDWLARNGMHHVNVSIESRDPAIYERMRKGARFRIFQENWDALMSALSDAGAAATPIRYIAMAYKSNLRELPDLTRNLIGERRAWQVEIRYSFDVPSIPPEFRAAEFLDEADWDWLADALKEFSPRQVQLSRPPPATPAAAEPALAPIVSGPPALIPGRAMFRLSWDGSLRVVGIAAASRGEGAIEHTMLETNIRDIADPATFFDDAFIAYAKGT